MEVFVFFEEFKTVFIQFIRPTKPKARIYILAFNGLIDM